MKSRQSWMCPECADGTLDRCVEKFPVRPAGHRVLEKMYCPNCHRIVSERYYYRGPLDWE
jgi:hypothetical protein